MGTQRNRILSKKASERDNFTCQKCKIQDKTARILEAHHIIPLVMGGKNGIDNLITLCNDCHHFAPNKKEEFDEYMKEECDGTMTIFLKAWKKVQEKLQNQGSIQNENSTENNTRSNGNSL